MTSRQRVLAAIERRAVDRVPIDVGGTRQSGISAFSYAPLRERLGLDDDQPFKVFDLCQMLAEIEPQVSERFGSDCVCLNRPKGPFGLAYGDWKPFEFEGIGTVLVPGEFNPRRLPSNDLVIEQNGEMIACMPAGGFYFDRLDKYPGASHPDLATYRAPRLTDADVLYYENAARELYEETDKAVIAAMGPPYELFYGLGQGGFEDWMITFASEDEYVEELYSKLVDAWLDNLQRFWRAVGDRVQIIQLCDDFGTQHGPFLSELMFRDKLLPAYKRGLDWVHQNTNWKVLLHSDGAIRPLLPAIIEMGVDILNPVQTTAAGMDGARLKAEFGDRLVFWGAACDSQRTLGTGTPEQVAQEVRDNIETFSAGGGFVLASVHNIQANVPAENIIAMFDAALETHPPHTTLQQGLRA